MAFAPNVGAMLLSTTVSELGIASMTTIMAVAGALADAATQGIAIAFGDQHGFSFKEMIENSAAAGFTAGVSKYFNVSELLKDGKYARVFATEVGIGITVQLFQIEMGLRQNIDPALIFEQAAGTIASAKINSEKMIKGLPNVVQHGADELANTAIGAAVGQKVDLMTAAANVVGDEAADGADMLAKHKQHNLSPHQDKEEDNQGVAPNAPQSYAQHAGSSHVDHRFNPGSAEKDDFTDFLDDAYDAQHQAIAESLSDSAEARIHEADEVDRHGSMEVHGHNTTASTKSWEQGLAEEVYAHQDSIWAKGIMGFCAALHTTADYTKAIAQAANTGNPVAAMQEIDTGRDPVTRQPVTTLHAYEHFAVSMLNMASDDVLELSASATAASIRIAKPAIAKVTAASGALKADALEIISNTGSKIGRGVSKMRIKRFCLFQNAEEKSIDINASSPSEIAWGYGKLSSRQSKLLDSLLKPGRITQLYKSDVTPTDLAALTAYTGDEFGLFTLGSRRIVMRGTSGGLEIRGPMANKLLSQGWKWSAHTHPGISDNVLMASGFPGDRAALKAFNQNKSLILNSSGRRSIFDLENDYAISLEPLYKSNRKPGY